MAKEKQEPLISPLVEVDGESIKCGLQIMNLIYNRYMEGSRGLNAETVVSSAAALVGEMAMLAGRAQNSQAAAAAASGDVPQTNEFLESVSHLLKSKIKGKGEEIDEFPEFFSFLEHTKANIGAKGAPVLTVDPYYSPHEPPAEAAAALRDDVSFLADQCNLDAWGRATACTIALMQIFDQVVGVTPPAIAYQLAMETAVGMAYGKPLVSENAKTLNKLNYSLRIHAASREIAERVIINNVALEDGQAHPNTVICVAGALAGEMALRAADDNLLQTGGYVFSACAMAFLEEAYDLLVASHEQRGGDKKELPAYEEFLTNAIESIGKDPYPTLPVSKDDLPHSWPLGEASLARKGVFNISKKYKLSDWDLASACTFAVAEIVANTSQYVDPVTGFRLAMTEAVAVAQVAPIDMDALMKGAPLETKRAFEDMKKRVENFRPDPS